MENKKSNRRETAKTPVASDPIHKKRNRTALITLTGVSLALALIGYSYFHLKQVKEVKIEIEQKEKVEEPTPTKFKPSSPSETKKPQIEISEETKKQESSELSSPALEDPNKPTTTATDIPKGFGLENTEQETSAPSTQTSSEEKKEEKGEEKRIGNGGIELDPINQARTPKDIATIDPRKIGVTANEGPDKNFEETILTVERTLTAILPTGEKQLIRLKVPVMYKSRTLSLDYERQKKAIAVLKLLKEEKEELKSIKKKIEGTLSDWNSVVSESTPNASLLPESPTLPQNQSANKLNRTENPNMAPGKAISYEIITK